MSKWHVFLPNSFICWWFREENKGGGGNIICQVMRKRLRDSTPYHFLKYMLPTTTPNMSYPEISGWDGDCCLSPNCFYAKHACTLIFTLLKTCNTCPHDSPLCLKGHHYITGLSFEGLKFENHKQPFYTFFTPMETCLVYLAGKRQCNPKNVFSPGVKTHWGVFHGWPCQDIIITHGLSCPCSSQQKTNGLCNSTLSFGHCRQKGAQELMFWRVDSALQTLKSLFISKDARALEISCL